MCNWVCGQTRSGSLFACALYYYKAYGRDDLAVRQQIKEIAATLVRYEMARIHVLLSFEGWTDNHKRVRRIDREEGLVDSHDYYF